MRRGRRRGSRQGRVYHNTHCYCYCLTTVHRGGGTHSCFPCFPPLTILNRGGGGGACRADHHSYCSSPPLQLQIPSNAKWHDRPYCYCSPPPATALPTYTLQCQ